MAGNIGSHGTVAAMANSAASRNAAMVMAGNVFVFFVFF
jgi:hypothetical protein